MSLSYEKLPSLNIQIRIRVITIRRLNAATNYSYWIPSKSDNSNTPTCDKHQPIDAIFPTALRRKHTWGLLRIEDILFTVLLYVPLSDAIELKRNGGGRVFEKTEWGIALAPTNQKCRTNWVNWRIKNQLDATYYFIVLLIGSTCFGHVRNMLWHLVGFLFFSYTKTHGPLNIRFIIESIQKGRAS